MRASRILASRPERAIMALAELCEERKVEVLVSAPAYVAPRLSPLPPQTPYSVGSGLMQHKAPIPLEGLSPSVAFSGNTSRSVPPESFNGLLPGHMAPRRGKWTSPPPPEASPSDHTIYEEELDKGLELATSSVNARERESSYNSSSSNSEVLTDEERSEAAESDEAHSVHSLNDAASPAPVPNRRASWYTHDTPTRIPGMHDAPGEPLSRSNLNGRLKHNRPPDCHDPSSAIVFRSSNDVTPFSKSDLAHRSISNVRGSKRISSGTPIAVNVPLPPSPDSPLAANVVNEQSTVFYQTNATRSPRPVLYPNSGPHHTFLSQYQAHHPNVPHDIFPSNLPSLASNLRGIVCPPETGRSSAGPETPTPTSFSHSSNSHHYSNSTMTITSPTPSPPMSSSVPKPAPAPNVQNSSPLSRSQAHTDNDFQTYYSHSLRHPPQNFSPHISDPHIESNHTLSPHTPCAFTDTNSSPVPSSTGYATSASRSPSPHSPLSTASPHPVANDLSSLIAKMGQLATASPQVVTPGHHGIDLTLNSLENDPVHVRRRDDR